MTNLNDVQKTAILNTHRGGGEPNYGSMNSQTAVAVKAEMDRLAAQSKQNNS